MGIRSLLRNAFGRSRTDRDEPRVPEAREAEPAAAPPAAETAPEATVPGQAVSAEYTPPVAEPVSPAAVAPETTAAAAPEPEPEPEPEWFKAEDEWRPKPAPEPEPEPDYGPMPEPDWIKADDEWRPKDDLRPQHTPVAAEAPHPEPLTADAAPDPVAEAQPEPVAEPAPVAPVAEAPQPEPELAEPDPEPTPEPIAAAEPAAPTTAEPVAPAEPAAPAPEPAAADGNGALAKVEATAPELLDLARTAATALGKQGLTGRRATVYLVLDRSGSMRRYYKDGTVQHLADQALALSANLDDSAVVPVVFFSTDVDGVADISLDNNSGRIEALHNDLGHMGRTNYHFAVQAVVDHYKQSGSTDPAFVIFQTDGAPTSKPAAEKALCEAAALPIFWQFVGFGDPEGKGFDFLRKLDNLTVPDRRPVDNAGFFHAGAEPRELADAELFQQLMVEFPEWLTEVREAGILR